MRTISRFLAVLFGCFAVAPAPAADPPPSIPIHPEYVEKFAACDRNNIFDGVKLPAIIKKHKWYDCGDHSELSRLAEIPATPQHRRAILYVAKLARDDDGSKTACGGTKGPTDNCSTALMLKPTQAHPCLVKPDKQGRCVPVDAENIPYIAMPNAAPDLPQVHRTGFHDLTGASIGDLAVVMHGGRVVAAMVGDAGPWNKIGEGSKALLVHLQADGQPRTIGQGVTYLIFPGTKPASASLSPDTLAVLVRNQACKLYADTVGVAAYKCD